jgi:geranylgeranyl diphosphate synthase type I
MKRILIYGPVLSSEIRAFIAAEKPQAAPADSWQNDFLRRLSPYATAGKLLRGSLVCFSYEAFAQQKPNRTVVKAAMALELIHSALLIHDDVMDNDDFRRGKPSLHSQYQAVGRKRGLADADRFGANMAICGADMCLFMAFGLLAGAPPTVNKLFTNILSEVCDGQMQDIYLQAQPAVPPKRSIYSLMKAKTASYSMSLPLTAGAVLAGQPPATLRKLRRVGTAAGMIFQIRDDELGVMGNTAKTGKPVGADIREGKKTLIYYYLMKTCSAPQRCQLKTVFGNPEISQDDIAATQKLIKRHRIPQLLNTEVRRLENRALKTLASLDLPRPDKAELKSLINFCARRQA